MITVEPKSSSCTAEENRINLERELGTKQFIKAYPVIEVILLIELFIEFLIYSIMNNI